MTPRENEFDERLRRALHAAADSVQPAGDGLERIRARLTAPAPLPVAWVMTSSRSAVRLMHGRLQPSLSWLGPAVARLIAAAAELARRLRLTSQGGAQAQRLNGWLRPAAALAAAVAVVAIAALAVRAIPEVLSTASQNQSTGQGSGSGHNGKSGVSGRGTHFSSGGTGTGASPGQSPGSPAASCTPSVSPPSGPTPSPSPSSSPSPTPTPTLTPSPTPTPTLSPTPTPTPSPSDSSTPGSGTSGSPGTQSDPIAAQDAVYFQTTARSVPAPVDVDPASEVTGPPCSSPTPSATPTVLPSPPPNVTGRYAQRPQTAGKAG